MQRVDGVLVFSPTDLVGYLACEHLTELERAAAAGLVARPLIPDPELDLIVRRGFEHEARILKEFEASGHAVTTIEPDASITDRAEQLREAAARTVEAMRRGDEVIYQAAFFDGRWRGFADFLVRVDAVSNLGPWSYEITDAKLARHTKAGAVLQLCSYSDQVARLQGRAPEHMAVALGGRDAPLATLRVADYAAYFRLVKARFEAIALHDEPPTYPPSATYPDPVEHCEVCRWRLVCAHRRRADDDLSLVAGISGRQKTELKARRVATRRGLAHLPLPLDPPPEHGTAQAWERVHEQARIQVEGEDAGRHLCELLEPSRLKDGSLEPDRGLLVLPDPSPGDLFFDIEGDPFVDEEGLEYLFGVIEPGLPNLAGDPTYHAFWATDRDGEKAAFERLIDLVVDRLERDPGLHVYHYAPYEPSAVKRLMGRYGTREAEVDRLLRGGVFVDLFRAVRQGLRASVESYSIKRLEPLYDFARQIDLRDAGSSIVAFEAWLEEGGSEGGDQAALDRIAGYNRDDCVSNWRLRDWLEARRAELAAWIGEPLPRPVPRGGDPAEALSEALAEVQAVADRLSAGVPADEHERTPEEHARWLLAQLLSWHRREDKSFWWLYHHLMDELTDEERIEASEPIGGLSYIGVVGETKRSFIHRYRFPPQDHDIAVGTEVRDPATGESPGTVVALDAGACTIDLKRGRESDAPHPTSLVPFEHVPTRELEHSLMRLANWVADHGIEGEGPARAARELLLRQPPRLGQDTGATLRQPDESELEAARRLALALDGSCLAVQGPPGSGKTYAGGRLIVDLVRAGKRVGVTANSHKVIGHLLEEVVDAAREAEAVVRVGQKGDTKHDCTCAAARCFDTNPDARAALSSGDIDVLGGTAWVWSREEFTDAVDVLVIDEAGQLSLANTVAVGGAARNLVLLGDPQQLQQPLKGTHPPGAERSALGHLLADADTMPDELGLFLARTWRLHPDLCAYTSEVFYDGRLGPQADLERQRLNGPAVVDGTGVRFVAVPHEGNDNASEEEAAVVAALVRSLAEGGATWIDKEGSEQPVGYEQVLVVTPYNAQVAEIAGRLPAGARVGTVDKFQGQQTPIALYSMATSSPELAPRGMEFLYDPHRLNVATSRARCVAVVVASPELVRVRCRTPRQMRLANALARLVELGEEAL